MLVAASGGDPVKYAKTLDRVAKDIGVNFIGGYSALVQKGFSAGDRELIESIPRALAETDFVCSSVNVGSTKTGINMDAVKMMGETVKKISRADKATVSASALPSWWYSATRRRIIRLWRAHFTVWESPTAFINVGVSGPGVVRAALVKMPKDAPSKRGCGSKSKKQHSKSPVWDSWSEAEASHCSGRSFRNYRPVAGTDSCSRRFSCIIFWRKSDLSSAEPAWHYSCPCHAQRCSEKRRRYGLLQCRRTFRSIHPGNGRCRHDRMPQRLVHLHWKSWKP